MKRIIYRFTLTIIPLIMVWGAVVQLQTKQNIKNMRSMFTPFKYHESTRSFYKGDKKCPLQIDHVVSIQDAINSGANKWSKAKKRQFMNDLENLVPACKSVNASKRHHPPKEFIRLSMDGKGVEVKWKYNRLCRYIKRYYTIKKKYNLSTANNDPSIIGIYKCVI